MGFCFDVKLITLVIFFGHEPQDFAPMHWQEYHLHQLENILDYYKKSDLFVRLKTIE
jgi:hypothetical protein